MAINFTTSKRKNLDLSFTSGTDILASLTSSLERGVTTLEVNKPQGLTLSSPNNAVELDTILADAEIAFQADGQGFTNGGSVSTWINNGTKGSDHNAVSGGDASRDPIYDTDDASNPFTTTGAIYFEDDQAQGSGGDPSSSHFLSLSNRYSAQNDMTLYVVAAYEDGFMPSQPPTIIETFIDDSDSNDTADLPNSETHHGYVMSFQTPSATTPNWSDGGVNKFIIVDKDTATGNTGGIVSDPGETFDLKLDITESFTSGTAEVFVVRKLKTSGDVFIYNGIGAQVGFIAGGTDDSAGVGVNPVSFTVDMDGFGRQKTYVGSFIFGTSLNHTANFADGKGVYVAAVGAFNKDIGDQKSKALGRLLGEKYLP
jgi:hypothetical protein